MPPIEEKIKIDEKAEADKAAAVTGAQAVADAVKKVADDAVTAAKNAAGAKTPDVVVTGFPGGVFEIRGDGFSSGGTVLVNGRGQHTDEWGAQYIRGRLDDAVVSGEVTIVIDSQTKKTGYLNVA